MKLWWETQAARINALSLRERIFLFLSIVACCIALGDMYWMSPAQLAHKQLTKRFETQNADLQRARDELRTVASPVDGTNAVRDELAAVQARLDAVNQQIKEVQPAAAESTPLEQVLVHLLSRHEGLTLVRTHVALPKVAAAKPVQVSTVVDAGDASAALSRQGVELTVSGPYPELTRYVQTLEKALPNVRWGSMKLKSDKQSTELTLELFLVGMAS